MCSQCNRLCCKSWVGALLYSFSCSAGVEKTKIGTKKYILFKKRSAYNHNYKMSLKECLTNILYIQNKSSKEFINLYQFSSILELWVFQGLVMFLSPKLSFHIDQNEGKITPPYVWNLQSLKISNYRNDLHCNQIY